MEIGINTCKNIFIHKTAEEMSAAFTELWVKVINESERYRSGLNGCEVFFEEKSE